MTNRNIYEQLSQGERVTLECKKKLRKVYLSLVMARTSVLAFLLS